MTKEWITDFYQLLSEKMEEITDNTVLCSDPDENEWILSCVLAVSEESEDYVLLHTSPVLINEDIVMNLVYIELKNEISNSILPELQSTILSLNNMTLLGTLGIVNEDRDVYFKYCCRLDDRKSLEENVEDTITVYEMMMGQAEVLYSDLKPVWDDKICHVWEETNRSVTE